MAVEPASPTLDQIVAAWREQGIRWVQFELPDLHGVARAKIIPLDHVLPYARHGLNMYGGTLALDTASSVVAGSLYHEEVRYADQALHPDLATAAVVPWLQDTARLICDPTWANGTPLRASPRYVLRRLLERAAELGYRVRVGLEYEFYVLDAATRQPLFDGLHIFNHIRNTYVPIVNTILEQMPRIGVDIITANCEYAPSQFEINFASAEGMRAADQAYTFKNGVKAIAHQAGLLATFMTKPFSEHSACGGHIHISLSDHETGRNLFLDESGPDRLSTLCRHFVAGQIAHASAAMALIAPTINCYHRYVPHHFAPSNASWGLEDRTALVRVKNTGDQRTHIENRGATAISNPYLAMAATLAAGLLGIQEQREPPPLYDGCAEDCGDFARLPRSLADAVDALEADSAFAALLGEEFLRVYTRVKRNEIDRFRSHVTDWERNEYLEIY